MIAIVILFFIPELVNIFGSIILFNLSPVHKIFWGAVANRERSQQKRGDYIDSIILLKNGQQDPIYSKYLIISPIDIFCNKEAKLFSAAIADFESRASEGFKSTRYG